VSEFCLLKPHRISLLPSHGTALQLVEALLQISPTERPPFLHLLPFRRCCGGREPESRQKPEERQGPHLLLTGGLRHMPIERFYREEMKARIEGYRS